MKKLILCVSILAAVAGVVLAQSGISNPVYKPHARIIIPVQQQPEFSGTQTNVLSFTTWETNGTAHVYSSTNIVAVVNTNTAPFAEFLLYAVDEETGEVVFLTSSIEVE